MNCRNGRIPDVQERAFRHPDVVTIATNVVRGRHSSLVRLTKLAILWPLQNTNPLDLIAMTGVPPAIAGRGAAIARAGLRIAAEPDNETRKRRRGAVVERIVWTALRSRDPNLVREQEIELVKNRWTNRPWSYPKEIVSQRPTEFEVVECKRDLAGSTNTTSTNSPISGTPPSPRELLPSQRLRYWNPLGL